MKMDKEITELISTIEYLIGSQCYNPYSYNGWTGEEGQSYRYPVSYRQNRKDKKLTNTKYKIEGLTEQQIHTMKYVFGSNHLFIGEGILKLLEELEKRYDLDFNSLEKERTKRRKSLMRKLQIELVKEKETELDAGRYICGLDIETGKYKISSDETTVVSICRGMKSKRKNECFVLDNNAKKSIILEKDDSFEINTMILVQI